MKNTVEHQQIIIGRQGAQHIVIQPDRPRPTGNQIHVPEGGAGWGFLLAAFAVIGWAAIKRHNDKTAWQQTA